MLPHYSSLKVAEQFRVLDAIAPGRIDLGLGRAPGSDGRTAFALNPLAETAADAIPRRRCATCSAWIAGEKLVEGHPFRDIIAQPMAARPVPEVWILGSSDYGPQVAAYFGLPFCFAHFITDGRGVEQAMAVYREGYRPSRTPPDAACARYASGRWRRKPRRRPRGCSPRARCGGWAAIEGFTPPCPRPRKPRYIRYSDGRIAAHRAAAVARAVRHAGRVVGANCARWRRNMASRRSPS